MASAATPGLTRDRPIEPRRTALLLVDVQNWVVNDRQAAIRPEFDAAVRAMALPNMVRLVEASRRAGLEVLYTVMENLTRDGRDRSLDYKLSGISIEKGSWDAKVLDAVAPAEDEIVLPKTSSSVFNSTSCAISGQRSSSWPGSSPTSASTTPSRTPPTAAIM
jgi:nicotinamidase-related amidase